MELCQGMDDEPAEGLWVRIKKETSMGNMVVVICYRPPDQEEVDEVFYRHLKVDSYLQDLIHTGVFNLLDMCYESNTTGYKQCRRFLKTLVTTS